MVAVAVLAVVKQVQDIKDGQKEIISILERDKKSQLLADYDLLASYMDDYKFYWENEASLVVNLNQVKLKNTRKSWFFFRMNPGFPDILAMPPDMRYNISKRMMRLLTEHTKSPGGHDSGAFLFCFGAGGLDLRLATSYILPSSHLQMQYAATLARTEIKNDEITLTKSPLLLTV
mgnify:FL=1